MITHVAIRFRDQVWSLPRPYRHHHIIRVIIWLSDHFGPGDVDCVDTHGDDQGFLTDSGQYLTRDQGEEHARACGQLNKPIIGGVLTSEDLW